MYHVIVIAYHLLGLHRTITASKQAITPQKTVEGGSNSCKSTHFLTQKWLKNMITPTFLSILRELEYNLC